jgi:hypothetical protein
VRSCGARRRTEPPATAMIRSGPRTRAWRRNGPRPPRRADEARQALPLGDDAGQTLRAARGAREPFLAVEALEEEGRQGISARAGATSPIGEASASSPGTDAAGRSTKPMVSPSSSSSRELQALHPFHQLRHAGGHVAQLAREDRHRRAGPCGAGARAVERSSKATSPRRSSASDVSSAVPARMGAIGDSSRSEVVISAPRLRGRPGHVAQAGRNMAAGRTSPGEGRTHARSLPARDRPTRPDAPRPAPSVARKRRSSSRARRAESPRLGCVVAFEAGAALAGQRIEQRGPRPTQRQRLVPQAARAEGRVDGAPFSGRMRPWGSALVRYIARFRLHPPPAAGARPRDEPDLLRLRGVARTR